MKAKKSLGQNFLKSEIALKKLVEAGEVSKNDIILEIGPGKGAITRKLLKYAGKVVAVEKDPYLISFLEEKFAEEIQARKLMLVLGDILDFDIQETVRQDLTVSYKIIANIPYNITGVILKKFLTEKTQPSLMVLLVQHEVAKRIVARDKKESILSISVKAYGKPIIIDKVPARYFSPAPKVDSAIIKITEISRKNFENNSKLANLAGRPIVNEEKFWQIVKKGFAHKRKKLSGNLKGLPLGEKISENGLGDKRAENLTLLDWKSLAK